MAVSHGVSESIKTAEDQIESLLRTTYDEASHRLPELQEQIGNASLAADREIQKAFHESATTEEFNARVSAILAETEKLVPPAPSADELYGDLRFDYAQRKNLLIVRREGLPWRDETDGQVGIASLGKRIAAELDGIRYSRQWSTFRTIDVQAFRQNGRVYLVLRFEIDPADGPILIDSKYVEVDFPKGFPPGRLPGEPPKGPFGYDVHNPK